MTRKEFVAKFAEHCGECKDCPRCRFYSAPGIGGCLDAYRQKLHSGEMKPEDSFEDTNPGDDDESK